MAKRPTYPPGVRGLVLRIPKALLEELGDITHELKKKDNSWSINKLILEAIQFWMVSIEKLKEERSDLRKDARRRRKEERHDNTNRISRQAINQEEILE